MCCQRSSRYFKDLLSNLLLAFEGQGLVEYAIIILFVALAVLAALSLFGQSLLAYYYRAVNAFP